MIKLFGSIFLLASGITLSVSLCRFHEKRLTTLDGLISLLLFIKGQVDCFSKPIGDILRILPPETAIACNMPQGIEGLWELPEANKLYLSEEGQRLLSCFCSEFGSTFREEQVRRCDYYIGALREQRKNTERTSEAKIRSSSALWICGALSLIILLL